jgi:nucleoside-diphosphate-sugar epimerase
LYNSQYLDKILPGMDVVFHNAGVTSGAPPELCQKVNVEATTILAQSSIKAGVRRFIYVSSRSAAGPNYGKFVRTEDDEDYPIDAYGKSKLHAEEQLYAMKDEMEIVSLRYALMYGPRDTHLLPIFKMVSAPIHPVPGLRAIYTPLLYLKDAARAAAAVVNARPGSFQSGAYYYVSDGVPYSMETMYDLILKALGKRSCRIRIPLFLVGAAAWFTYSVLGKNTGFTPESVQELRSGSRLVSPFRFMRDFNWQPQVLPYDAFTETVRWYREQGWLPNP